jgi:hypothetical protein
MGKRAGGADGYAVSANETEPFGSVKRNRDRFLILEFDDLSGARLAADSTTGACFFINDEELHDIVLPFPLLLRTWFHARRG